MSNKINKSKLKGVKIEKLIVIQEVTGTGKLESPLTVTTHYYDLKGTYLFSK